MAPVPATPLVGRDSEVAALGRAADDARAGSCRCAVVAGEAGIGKTRLVAEVVHRLDDALVLTGHAADMSTGEIPFGVLADTLRDLHRLAGDDALTAAERAALAPLLPDETGEADRVRILSGGLDLVGRLAEQRLLVWVVEDLHWADDATRDLVNMAVRTLRGRLLVVLTVRTHDPDRSPAQEARLSTYVTGLARLPHVEQLDLRRLTDDEVRRQLAALVVDLEPAESRRIVRLADGVPFVVEELAAAQGRPDVASAGTALAGRVERLGAEARRLVDAAAVGDGHLRISLLEQVVDATPEELDAALAEALAAGVLTSDLDSDRLAFRHALLRDAADRGMGPGARRSWHRRWAEVLQANPGILAPDPAALAVAEHWHHARDRRRAAEAAYAALPAARRTSDANRQFTLWTRVLQGWEVRDPDTPVGRLTLRDVVGDALRRPGAGMADRETARTFLATLRAQQLDRAEQSMVDLVESMWGTAKTARTHESAVTAVADVCDWLAEPPDQLTRSVLAILPAVLPAEDARAEAYARRATVLAEEAGDADRLVSLAIARGFRAHSTDGAAAATTVMEEALERLPDIDPEQRFHLVGNLAWSLIVVGRHREAQELLSRHLAREGHPETMPGEWEHLTENLAFSLICTGDWSQARAAVDRGAPAWVDDLRMSNLWVTRLDLLESGRAETERWRDRLGGDEVRGGPTDVEIRHVLAVAEGLRGDLAALRTLAGPGWEARGPLVGETMWPVVVDLARAEADAAAADPGRADRAEAEAHLGAIREASESYRRDGALTDAWRRDLTAQLDRFHGRDPREALAAALGAWAAIGHVPDVAACHLSLAEAHCQAGERDTAREHLATARGVAIDLGARPMLERADAIVERYALHHRDAGPGHVLTDRETEVLTLLAEGRTNKEIAQALFMAPKTASVHVSRILTKLGATNRTEAATLARRRGLLEPAGSTRPDGG